MARVAVDFLRGSGLLSRAIEGFGFGAGGYSHAASVLADSRYLDSRNDRIAGVKPGVHIRHPDTEKWIAKRTASLQVTDAEYVAWEANLRAKIGDAYGKSDILGFILAENYHKPAHYICSALAVNALQHIRKVRYPLPLEAHAISPTALLLILATAGFDISEEIRA